ncbi:MAG: choice-of-anchor D domain-containing protein, partial [Gammaproteobacteria bacterium]
MKTKNYLLSIVLGLIAFAGFAQANDSNPLVFVSIPEIPSSAPTSGDLACYPYLIKNELNSDSLPLDISLVPNTDARISIVSNVPVECLIPAQPICGHELKPGQSCTILVEVNPANDTTPSQSTEILTIEYSPRYNPLESPIVIDFIEPAPAILQITSPIPNPPAQVILGDAAIPFEYIVTNISDEQSAATITASITQLIPNNPSEHFVDFVLPATDLPACDGLALLPPGDSCYIQLQVVATDPHTVGIQFGYQLEVKYEGLGDTYPLLTNIEFVVIQPPAFLNFVAFPDNLPATVPQGNTSPQFTFTIENFGSVDADIGTITNSISFVDQVISGADDCSVYSYTLPPNETCTVTLQIDATSADTGIYENILQIPYQNSSTSPLQDVFSFAVIEESVDVPVLQLSCETIDPIEIPDTIIETCTLSNVGSGTAMSLDPVLDLDYGFITMTTPVGACPGEPFNLIAGGSCTLNYTISPTVVGTSTQTVSITYEVVPTIYATVTGDIDFYAYEANPGRVYVTQFDPLFILNHVYTFTINSNGTLNYESYKYIDGVTSVDFSTGGTNYAYTSAVLDLFNDPVQRCTLPDLASCTTPSTLTNASYGYFIKFYKPTIALLDDPFNRKVKTCAVN